MSVHQTVSVCPMCGSGAQHNRFTAVPDFVFGATDERWSIDQCDRCESLFLANRPDKSLIGRYYERYYTHENEAETPAISGISIQSGMAKKLANSWRNHKYGSRRPSLGIAGVVMALVFPPLRGWIEAECRYLPDKASPNQALRVLDVGYGDGRFLKFAKEIGHGAAGLEIDPKAVEQARAEGLDVHQGDIETALSIWGAGYFDYITMSHVIEHVYDPCGVIATASKLLKPGGRLWVECPNPKARGVDYYGARWRDLDPPRHLCIPSLEALRACAAENGFTLERRHHRPFVPFEVYPFSARASGRTARTGYFKAAVAEVIGLFHPKRQEWLTLTFRKVTTVD
ncbi:Methyltransferase domain-containing protein [Sphingomonas laterariae]|uniref:Methyltransferase domain-containing protein n=1 Tax=Edaphosphingomonas laterariae TaxID=861865 RepID=A0A239JZ65_9SPHN|nr:class I SAM-dependent methyltransferase [Sphingomonas laterariae]SNT10134.1 Methyltransferase domain-containing protein [Sphingomonas laterariae]